jgi:putative transposase
LASSQESALLQLLFRGELEIKEIAHPNNSAKKNNYLSADFSQISSLLKEEAKRRYKYTKRVLELNLSKRTSESLTPIIQQVSREIVDEHPPKWRTLCRWLYDYESSGQDIRSLVPRHSAKGNRRQLDEE